MRHIQRLYSTGLEFSVIKLLLLDNFTNGGYPTLHSGAFSLVILAAEAARQHSPSSDRLGPTRACADFTDSKKTALSLYPNNLGI